MNALHIIGALTLGHLLKERRNMRLDRIFEFALSVVFAAYLTGNLPEFNRWVLIQTAKLLAESRSSDWGSPHFWPAQK